MSEHKISEKWGSALDGGFQVIPNVLLQAQSRLQLDAMDIVILLNLNLHWWGKDTLPYPPPALIARRMGVSRRTIERRVSRLQQQGWLKRLPATGTDAQPKIRKYDLSGLVERLQKAARIGISQRNYRATRSLRKNRQRARLEMRRERLLLSSGKRSEV